MDDNDLLIENILDRKKPKKKKDSKAKGDRTELNLCKLLTEHFGVEFSRSSGSGNRWSQVQHLPEHAKKTLTGDVCVPEGFSWVIESKGGYEDDIDLNSVLYGNGISRLDEFIEQSNRDAGYCGRKPIICWKRNRKPWLAMIKLEDLSPYEEANFPYRIHYREWIILPLEEFLKFTKKNYWFN
jgi:Holliday junction resolvase